MNYTYEFDELCPYKGVSLLAYGEADLECRWNSAQPDVGIMSGYFTYDVGEIRLYASEKGKPNLVLDPKSELYRLIEDALQEEYYGSINGELEDADLARKEQDY